MALLILVACTAVSVPGCGSRVDRSQGALRPATPVPPPTGSRPPAGLATSMLSEGRPDAATVPTTRSATAPVGPQRGVAGIQPRTPGAGQAPAAVTSATADAGAAGPPAATATVRRGPDRPKSPVVIASVGSYSGPVGTLFVPMVQGVQAWVAEANADGGLDGHAVRFIVADDGGDGARSRALVQDMVERQGAVAFVQMAQGLSGPGSVEYLTEKRIPVIGSETGSPWFYDTSPMFFPQVSSGVGIARALLYSAAERLIPSGKKKLGTIVCVEAQVCREGDAAWAREASAVGFDLSYRGTASLGQPDFTAQCLAARNRGADVILIGLDTNSVGRLASSCARQGYRPVFAILGGTLADQMQHNPDLAGAVSATPAFPYIQSGTPATDEYQAVIRRFGENIVAGQGPATGWVSAKLFERAAADLSEPLSSAAILRGLWNVHDDDLGGLTQPLSFAEDRPTSLVVCWWDLQITARAWSSPDRFRRHCR